MSDILGCQHGRALGVPCPHCLGISALSRSLGEQSPSPQDLELARLAERVRELEAALAKLLDDEWNQHESTWREARAALERKP